MKLVYIRYSCKKLQESHISKKGMNILFLFQLSYIFSETWSPSFNLLFTVIKR